MKIQAWAILTSGLADGYELTKSPARVQAAKENGQTVVELIAKQEENESYRDLLYRLHDMGFISTMQYSIELAKTYE